MDPSTGKKLTHPVSGLPITTGEGTMQAVLDDLLAKAQAQYYRLNETRQQLTATCEELIATIEEVNTTKGELRVKLAKIVQLNEKINGLTEQVNNLTEQVSTWGNAWARSQRARVTSVGRPDCSRCSNWSIPGKFPAWVCSNLPVRRYAPPVFCSAASSRRSVGAPVRSTH